MRLYVEPVLSYNEFEQELQVLELSTILEDDKGNIIRESNHTFSPIFGIDLTVMNWLNREEKLVGHNDSKETIEKEIEELNNLIDEETVVISWNDIFNELPNIKSHKRIIAYHVTKEGTTLSNCYNKATGEFITIENSSNRVKALKKVYEHYRGEVIDAHNSLTDEVEELNQKITDNIEE